MANIFNVDIDIISQLAELVSDNELSEITLESGDSRITVKGKKCPPPPPVMSMPVGMPAASAAPVNAAETKAEKPMEGNVVKSPIVGTFYQSPSPDKPPFVKVGDKVKKGDVIMIIESMKLMNEVQSEFSGTVERILVTDGQAVEYDQPIMIIK
ncbi:MAG: acetyl-CoA carboxylase biotin carboxyl carrier protein [Ruminococcus sp.]|nr:acetyl-CoA carboxylase biotin carboxyl carrier protein [Ruminococcus sp.]